MLSQNRRRFREYPGDLKRALKLTQPHQPQEAPPLQAMLRKYGGENFKAHEYL